MRTRIAGLVMLLSSVCVLACGGGSSAGTSSNVDHQTAAASEGARSAGSPTPTLRGSLTVFAASSLTDAFNEIGAAFQKDNPSVAVKLNFGASSMLRTQLEQGVRADLFASADQPQMDAARKANVIQGEDKVFVKNKLVLIVPAANPGKVTEPQDLARPGLKLVLTDKAVPIGAYARTALEKMSADPRFGADFAQKALANVKSEEANVRAVVTKVQLGEADAAIVYATDITPGVARDIQSIVIPDQFNTVATYPIAVVNGAANSNAARAFIAYVRSAAGQAILVRSGFIVDRDTGSS